MLPLNPPGVLKQVDLIQHHVNRRAALRPINKSIVCTSFARFVCVCLCFVCSICIWLFPRLFAIFLSFSYVFLSAFDWYSFARFVYVYFRVCLCCICLCLVVCISFCMCCLLVLLLLPTFPLPPTSKPRQALKSRKMNNLIKRTRRIAFRVYCKAKRPLPDTRNKL